MLSTTLLKQVKHAIRKYLQHSPNFNTITVTHLTSLLNLLFDTNEKIEESDIIDILLDLKFKIKNRYDSKIIAAKRWSFNIFIQIVYITMYLREINFKNEYNIRYLETVGLQKLVIDIFCYKCNIPIEIITKYNKYPHIIYENILLEGVSKGLGIVTVSDNDSNNDTNMYNSNYLLCPSCYSLWLQRQKYLNSFSDHKKLDLLRQQD